MQLRFLKVKTLLNNAFNIKEGTQFALLKKKEQREEEETNEFSTSREEKERRI